MAGSRKGKRRPKRRTQPASPSRAEVARLRRMVLEQSAVLDRVREEQAIQFRRMAQLQAELDSIKQALDKSRNA